MKLATLRDGSRDGQLCVVRKDHSVFASAHHIAPSLQAALDDWEKAEPALRGLAGKLESGEAKGAPLEWERLGPPLPRAYEWVDASAYLNHVRLVRKARGAEPPADLETSPLVYQGGSGVLLGPYDDLFLGDPAWGLDLEGELCVVLGDTPQYTRADEAGRCIRLLLFANDVSLRNLVPGELAKGFGFFQSKPATAFSPLAVTPDELGGAWREGRAYLTLRVAVNGQRVGELETGSEMHFSFAQLIQHLTLTRAFTAGTLLGSGTVSNADSARGVSCLVERRMREILDGGKAVTPYLAAGDSVEIELFDAAGNSVCGRLAQKVVGR